MENPDVHNTLIGNLRQGWEALDVELIAPLLADDLHYHSRWALIEFYRKEDYIAYIRERFDTYRKSPSRPEVKLGVNKNDGEQAVALQFTEDVPMLIRIREDRGKIVEMWIQPAY